MLRHNQILKNGRCIAVDGGDPDTFRRVGKQFLEILRRRADEDELEAGIGTTDALDRVLEDYSALVVTDLMRLINDQQIDRDGVAEDVGEQVQPLLSEDEDETRTAGKRSIIYLATGAMRPVRRSPCRAVQ